VDRQPAVGALLVPDVHGGVGQGGDVVEDLAAESSLWSACISMICKWGLTLARCESIPAIGVIPIPALANTIGRPE
jgi:hypothetical protein